MQHPCVHSGPRRPNLCLACLRFPCYSRPCSTLRSERAAFGFEVPNFWAPPARQALLGGVPPGRQSRSLSQCQGSRLRILYNLSCPLQTLNGERQQKADDLQLETSGRHRMDLPRKHSAQITENRLDVLASGLAQELFPCSHRPLGSLLALSFEVQADLF